MLDFNGKRILIVGAHPDDFDFGMGGTINQIREETVKLVMFSDSLNYPGNNGIVEEFCKAMQVYDIPWEMLNYTNMNFPAEGSRIRQELTNYRASFRPDIVFSTSPKSVNPDHAELGKSVKAVFQECDILFYEVLRGDYEHLPEFYNEISAEDLMTKLRAINCYTSQQKRVYAGPDRVTSFAQMRGAQANVNYAESFEIYRMIRKIKK